MREGDDLSQPMKKAELHILLNYGLPGLDDAIAFYKKLQIHSQSKNSRKETNIKTSTTEVTKKNALIKDRSSTQSELQS